MRRTNVEYSSKYRAEYCTATFAKRVLYASPYLLINNKTMIQKFRKKPVEVEAIQWNGNTNRAEIVAFVGKELNTELESETAYLAGISPPIFSLLIETKEGVMKAFKGDWIVKEPFPTGDRDFYPVKNEIFVNIYDVV